MNGLGKSLYPFKQFIFVDEDFFRLNKKKKKKNEKIRKTKL